LYEMVGRGPRSVLLPKGTRLSRIPRALAGAKRLLLSTFSHEPGILPADNSLLLLNDSLNSAPVFLQEYSNLVDDTEIVNVPFPFSIEPKQKDLLELIEEELSVQEKVDEERLFINHPAVKTLREKLSLDSLCGYIALMNTGIKCAKSTGKNAESVDQEMDYGNGEKTNGILPTISSPTSITKDPRKIASSRNKLLDGEEMEDFILLDCVFGIPLFDEELNRVICRRIIDAKLLDSQKWAQIQFANHNLAAMAVNVLHRFQMDVVASFDNDRRDAHPVPSPVQSLLFDGKNPVISIRL